jgi:prepilin peptidase CpaA
LYQTSNAVQWGVVIGASLVAALSDVRTQRIPNALTVPLLAAGLIQAGWLNGLAGLGEAVAAAAVLFAPFLLLWMFAGGGAGDAKLMAGIGAWLGLAGGLAALFFIAAAGFVLAVAKAIAGGRLKEVAFNVVLLFYSVVAFAAGRNKEKEAGGRTRSEDAGGQAVPYGLAIFAGVSLGACYVFLWH